MRRERCFFNGVTGCGRVLRQVSENDAWSVHAVNRMTSFSQNDIRPIVAAEELNVGGKLQALIYDSLPPTML